jgi:hypothetical integral membrane protein (TIGR02206 family)
MGEFRLFGLSHGIVLFVLIAGAVWIFRTRRFEMVRIQRYGIFVGLLLHLIIFNGYHVINDSYELARYLPFHLCSLSAVMTILTLWFDRPFLRQLTIYWAPIAAFIAILLPDIGASDNFPTFRFIEFFTSHTLICWGTAWLLANRQFLWTLKSVAIAYGSLVAMLPVIALVNRAFQGNYLYMMQKPNGGQMDFLGAHHFGPLVLLVLGVFGLEMLIFRYLQQYIKPRTSKGVH